jgi:signal transduction histidine kinase
MEPHMHRLVTPLLVLSALTLGARLCWRLGQMAETPAQAARGQVQEQLEQSYSQLRELSAALQTIREEERKHIARELHDDLGQLLATLRGDLALLQRYSGNSAAARQLQAGMDELLMSAITSLRRIAGNLRPRALDEGGVVFCAEQLAPGIRRAQQHCLHAGRQ